MGGITYGNSKVDLATVVHNGVGGDHPRVMPRTNEAIQAILGFDFICVNGMMTADIASTTESGKEVLLLPKEMENAIEVEILAAEEDANFGSQGWNLVTNFTYVDPSNAHDDPLIDLGLVPDPGDPTILRRKYIHPMMMAGQTARVTGAKRYVPITDDDDYLIVQNVPAVKIMILSIERYENNDRENAKGYKEDCKTLLLDEVKKFQLDPTNSMKRKANYQSDLAFYAEGTLGRTRARLALELTGFLQRGKTEITYLINRAVQMLVDNRNQLAIAGRISVHGTITELAYAQVSNPATVLAWPDYNQIRLMVQSFVTESGDAQALSVAEEYQKKAFELQRAQLIEATEKARHTTYTTALSTYNPGQFGYSVARLALELEGGLAMTTIEIERLLNRAEQRLLERGIWKNCLQTLSATITGGEILFPRDVESVLSANICGMPTDIRSVFFQFQKNGPGGSIGYGGLSYIGCSDRFDDLGEVYFPMTGFKRRKYRYLGSSQNDQLTAVVKTRYVSKSESDELVIKNQEALQLMCQSIMCEKKEDWNGAAAAKQMALDVLEFELREFLGGIQHVANVDEATFGFGGIGSPL